MLVKQDYRQFDSGTRLSLHDVGRDGELRLTFAQRNGLTVLAENYSRPPLQVMRAIRDQAGCLCVYLVSPTGGIVQGDHYTIQIVVEAQAHALITTQAATKIYRMTQGCAEQSIRIEVQDGAFLEFVPDAAILFADADFCQQIEIILHPGALLLFQDMVMPGRLARGEFLNFRRYGSRLIVRDACGLLLHDQSTIEPGKQDLTTIGRLEGFSCWGSLYLAGDLAAWGIDAAAFCQAHQNLAAGESAIGALSPLYRSGLIMRMLSLRLETIYAAFHYMRAVVRQDYLGLPQAPLRK